MSRSEPFTTDNKREHAFSPPRVEASRRVAKNARAWVGANGSASLASGELRARARGPHLLQLRRVVFFEEGPGGRGEVNSSIRQFASEYHN